MLSRNLENSLHRALSIASNFNHEYVTLEHLLLSLIDDEDVKYALNKCNANLLALRKRILAFLKSKNMASIIIAGSETKPTMGFKRVIHRAQNHAKASGKKEINGVNILIEIFSESDSYSVFFLYEQNITCMEVINYELNSASYLKEYKLLESNNNSTAREDEQTNILEEFCINLNKKAAQGLVDILMSREKEIERTIDVLSRRTKNNVIYIGDPGVGKTAVVEGLALKIVNGEVTAMKNMVIYALDMASLLAGTRYRGDFEERVKLIIKAITSKTNAVLFIDEIHTIIGAGATNSGSIDASNLLKPTLARGHLRCIGATTYKEYYNIFEKDMALARRFQTIYIEETSLKDTVKILEGIKTYYEIYHRVKYTKGAITQIVQLADRYIHNKMLPDKAVDVMDELGAYYNVRCFNNLNRQVVTIKNVKKIISRISNIPFIELEKNDLKKLQRLSTHLKNLIFGQDEAIDALIKNIKIAKSGLRDTIKPIGSYLFAGTTGVGKTELAKQLATALHLKLIRFDMSEYMESHSIARMIGSPPGYVGHDKGGMLTEMVSRNPYSVLLLDEIEKAHRDVYNILLQIMDYGCLTDSTGKKVNFSNVILIMTTNAGADDLSRNPIGFSRDNSFNENTKAINDLFSPEFRNRLDTIITFKPISKHVVEQIFEQHLKNLNMKLRARSLKLILSKTAREKLIALAYNEHYGARYVERMLNEEVKSHIAERIVSKNVKNKVIEVNTQDDKLVFKLAELIGS